MSKRLNISSNSFHISHTKRCGYNPTGTPLTGTSNARGMKNRDFRPSSRFISEMIQDRAIVTMEGEQETVPKISNGAISSDLE